MRISWRDGIHLQYKNVEMLLDPIINICNRAPVFISHGHHDHSFAFRLKNALKFSSIETMHLVSAFGAKIENWQRLTLHKKVIIDDIEVIPRNSGHVLGSYEFEICSPDGSILFTGDFNTEYTKTMRPAEPVHCDVLILEATFGSPSFTFPPKEKVANEMVTWAKNMIREGKCPTFQTDPLGNAQEVTRIFNEAGIPVVTHWKVTRVSDIYRSYGYKLEYVDEKSEDAKEIIETKNFVFITPKNYNVRNRREYVPALVSGWAVFARREAFPLSDHADFPNLIKFVEECKPKVLLTCHGEKYDECFARYVESKLKIRAYPIHLIPTYITREG